MPIPIRQHEPTSDPEYTIQWTDDGSATLVRGRDQAAFHSGCGAISECDHVYVGNGGFDGPTAQWPRHILEVGFGAGISMLRTIRRVHAHSEPIEFHYVGLESEPLSRSVLESMHLDQCGSERKLIDQFLEWWNDFSDQGMNESTWLVRPHCRVTIIRCDAAEFLKTTTRTFETVYFDPFDPATNPELWTTTVFAGLHRCLRPGGRLVSYCVKRQVQRDLTSVGFEVRCVPGPTGGKREVLLAIRQAG
ncbi:MAG: tRNA (5-methylaminomethyl-2-thiouridine)(34)-methyltransferase MnmD [Planctomycetota bacterium]